MARAGTPRSAKILILDLPNLPTVELKNIVIHCPTLNDLFIQSDKYSSCIIIIVCTSDKLVELSTVLPDISLDTLYVLNLEGTIDTAIEPWWNKTTAVFTEKQLMRHLCTKSMLCYYNEGMEHRKNGDMGLCNRSMIDSLRALDYSAKFI